MIKKNNEDVKFEASQAVCKKIDKANILKNKQHPEIEKTNSICKVIGPEDKTKAKPSQSKKKRPIKKGN